MIYNYPFFNFPHSRNYYPYRNYNSSYVNNVLESKKVSPSESQQKKERILSEKSSNEDNSFFEIFGLKLYYDDILLICLIFFLYKEDIKDNYLMFALVLLLLT